VKGWGTETLGILCFWLEGRGMTIKGMGTLTQLPAGNPNLKKGTTLKDLSF